jgi:hypothetical protein
LKQIPPLEGWQYKAGLDAVCFFSPFHCRGKPTTKTGASPLDDLQQVILDEVRLTRGELKAHIKDEDQKFKEVQRDITDLKTTAALQKQRANQINAFIAMITSAITAFLVSKFGRWM